MSQISPAMLTSLSAFDATQNPQGNATDRAGFYTVPPQAGLRGRDPVPVMTVYESLMKNRASGAPAPSFMDFAVGIMGRSPESLLYTVGENKNLYNFKNPLGGGIGPTLQNDGTVAGVLYDAKGQGTSFNGQSYLQPGTKIHLPPALR